MLVIVAGPQTALVATSSYLASDDCRSNVTDQESCPKHPQSQAIGICWVAEVIAKKDDRKRNQHRRN